MGLISLRVAARVSAEIFERLSVAAPAWERRLVAQREAIFRARFVPPARVTRIPLETLAPIVRHPERCQRIGAGGAVIGGPTAGIPIFAAGSRGGRGVRSPPLNGAFTAMDRQDWARAADLLTQLRDRPVGAGPLRAEILVNLGICLRRLGRAGRALETHQLAARSPGGKSVVIFAELAVSYHDVGQLKDALRVLREGIGVYPRSGRLRRLKAVVLRKMGRTTEAKRAIDQAIRLDHGNSLSHCESAKIRMGLRQFRQAHRDIDQAIALSGGEAVYFKVKGEIYLAEGDFNLATQMAESAIRLGKREGAFYVFKSQVLMAEGKLDAAREVMENALERFLDDPGMGRALPGLYEQLLRVLTRLGRRDLTKILVPLARQGGLTGQRLVDALRPRKQAKVWS